MAAFEFQPESDGSLSTESAVFQALGAGSTCWDDLSGAGVFDSTRAKEIGDKLVEFIGSHTLDPGLNEHKLLLDLHKVINDGEVHWVELPGGARIKFEARSNG